MTGSLPPPLDEEAILLPFPEKPLDWLGLFGNSHPVELEVGPGKGLFLVSAALARPAHNFLGVEISRKFARRTAQRVAKNRLANVRAINGDAKRLLSSFVPAASLAAVHVYFPDPWWKKRHKKRRVFNEDFVLGVSTALQPGGDLLLATDVQEYFNTMIAVLTAFPQFVPQPIPQPHDPQHNLDYLTNFERKYRIEGRPIYRHHYRKSDSNPPISPAIDPG